jgi:hypothetical protein
LNLPQIVVTPRQSPRERRAHKKKAFPAQRCGHFSTGPAVSAENPIYQGDLAPAADTVRDGSKQNNSATGRAETGKIRGICSRAVRSTSTPTPQTPFIPPLVFERDDGLFALGWHDGAPGPFESRSFALAVAAGQVGLHARSAVSS